METSDVIMIPKCRVWTGQRTRYAHVKRDGLALVVSKDPYGVVTAVTRTPADLTSALRPWGWMQNAWSLLPPRTTLLGELWAPGRRASAVKTAVIERDPALRFDAFAVAAIDQREGRFTSEALPGWPLERCAEYCALWGQRFVPWEDPDAVDTSGNLQRDVEGYVFKDSNLSQWYKWKPVQTVDLVVTGFVDGRGKHLGLVGALRCSVIEGHEVARVGGMDEATRLDVSEAGEAWLGRVVEVAYQYVGDGGRLRHPRFLRWREDKPAADCGLWQDQDLERHWRGEEIMDGEVTPHKKGEVTDASPE